MEAGLSLKRQQRKQAKALRDSLSLEYRHQASKDMCAQLLALPQVQYGQAFSIYLSTGSEVETDEMVRELLKLGKQVYTPRCGNKGQMECYRVYQLEEIQLGAYGIREPKSKERLETPDVIVVPALAFASDGHRIGYGGGYYDRYLARFEQTFSVGLCFAQCMRSQVVADVWDQPVSLVLTERS